MDCGKILIEAYLKSNQIRSNSGGNVLTGIVESMRGLYDIYCYLTGADWEVMRLGVGLREGDRINF